MSVILMIMELTLAAFSSCTIVSGAEGLYLEL